MTDLAFGSKFALMSLRHLNTAVKWELMQGVHSSHPGSCGVLLATPTPAFRLPFLLWELLLFYRLLIDPAKVMSFGTQALPVRCY